MVNKNIQMKKREGNDWDNLFPITLTDNVYDVNGVTIENKLIQTNDHIDSVESDLLVTKSDLTDTKNELNSIVETQEIVLNVGDNEEFKTLNSALVTATKYTSRQLEEKQKIVILLKSGFVLKEQILVDGLNLGHIKLKSEDPEVVISREHIIEDYGLGYRPVFYFTNNATSFIIDVLFNMNNTGGNIIATAFYVRNNSRITFEYFAGCKNASRRGLHCSMNSRAVANNTIFTNSGEVGIRSGNGSQITCEDADVSNSHWGISSTRSTIDASNIVANGCNVGVGCNGNSTVSVDGGSFLNSDKAFEVRNLSSLFADNATIETENSITIQTGSRVALEGANVDSVQPAISMTNSQLVAPRSTFTGSNYSISASSNSVITLNNATFNRLTLGSGTLANLNASKTTFIGGVTLNFVHGGNIVNAFNAELEFSTLPINEWFTNGIIYK